MMNYRTLNKYQIEATNHLKGAMIVIAGPGSGKTTVITQRVKKLIEHHKVSPQRILVITFNKNAVNEIKTRFEMENKLDGKVHFSTFHSLFYKIIRDFYGYTQQNIINEFEKQDILKYIAKVNGISYESEEDFLKNIILEISLVKNELIELGDYSSFNFSQNEFKKIYNDYEEYKLDRNKIDFDDMLIKCYYVIKNNENFLKKWKSYFDYILVDEFQDINKVQYMCLKLLCKKNNIFVVGDDDQSIYKFRGAKPEFLFEFIKDYDNVKKITLEINYRSTDEIISISNKIIGENSKRYEKKMKGVKGSYKKPKLLKYKDLNEESYQIANKIKKIISEDNIQPKEIGIIFRTNIQGRGFSEAFENLKIPYIMKDKIPTIYNHFIVKDIITYFKLAQNKNDKEMLIKIANKPKRYLSKKLMSELNVHRPFDLTGESDLRKWEIEKIRELEFYLKCLCKRKPYEAIKYLREGIGYNNYIEDYAEYKKIKPKNLYEIINEIQEISKKFETIEEFLFFCNIQKDKKNDIINCSNNCVTLTTFHSAKGLEFEVVFIISVVNGLIPHEMSKKESEIEEERRLFYVGVTRAKKYLYLSTIKTRYDKDVEPSCFIKKLKKKGE